MNVTSISRRRLLTSVAAGTVGLGIPVGLPRAARGASSVALQVVLLADDAPPDTVQDVIRVLVENGVPVGLALAPDAPATGLDPLRADPLVRADGILSLPPYFQARTLTEQRHALHESLAGGASVQGVVAPDPGGPLDLRGLSAPRLVNAFLIPKKTEPAWVETYANQVTATRGGFVVRAGMADEARAYLVDVLSDPAYSLATLYIDLSGPQSSVFETVTQIAHSVGWEVGAGRLVPLAPSELGARFSEDFRRLVGLRLDPPEGTDADSAAALDALTKALDAAGVRYSIARDDPAAVTPSDCLKLGPNPDLGDLPRGLDCALVPQADATALPALAEAGTLAALEGVAPGFIGLDGGGLLHLPSASPVSDYAGIELFGETLPLASTSILALDTDAIARPAQRNGAVAALRRLVAVPGTRIVDIPELARLVLAPDPLFTTMRQTRIAAPSLVASPSVPLTKSSRRALLEDAARAWTYFETVSDSRTGLPAATVAFFADGTPNVEQRVLTQWDIGSAFFAQIAALKLGIIATDTFLENRDAYIAALYEATLPDPKLPRALFDTQNPSSGSNEFNMCDTARLLSALSATDRASPDGDDTVRKLVESWDLAAAIVDGKPHSYDGRAFYALPGTHCSNYIARAMAPWGLIVTSQYDNYYRGETETDRQMYLLETVSEIGALGAEPLLLEGLEIGFDAPTSYLRDVLLAAQIAETEATGRLYAPSESPLETPPWFTYQGLRVDYEGSARWDVQVISKNAEYDTEEYRQENQVIPTKAAYLWAAAHPHPYSEKLLAYAREHGALSKAFASAIYTATDTPTANYADVNTNGIILEAIAHLLGG